MIKTKYIYTPKETSDGTRILIARKWPRGIRKGHFHERCKVLSPEEDTLKKMVEQQKDRRGLEKIFVQIPSTDERE